MKGLRIIIGTLTIATSLSHAAVTVHVLPQPLEIFNTDFPVAVMFPLDVDANGTTDFTFMATNISVSLRTERANRLVINVSPPPNLGGPVASLQSNFLIGPSLMGSDVRWTSSDIIGSYVSPDELVATGIIQVFFSGHNTQFRERSVIGVEFEAEDGIHYGYFDISPSPWIEPRITLHGWAWETEPGKAILAGQVPEPSSWILAGVATASLLLLRRRE